MLSNAVRLIAQINKQGKAISHANELSTLLSSKLVDMIKIELEEGTYHKTKEWCKENSDKYKVESKPQQWSIQFNAAFNHFSSSDYLKSEKGKSLWDNFFSIAQFLTDIPQT